MLYIYINLYRLKDRVVDRNISLTVEYSPISAHDVLAHKLKYQNVTLPSFLYVKKYCERHP